MLNCPNCNKQFTTEKALAMHQKHFCNTGASASLSPTPSTPIIQEKEGMQPITTPLPLQPLDVPAATVASVSRISTNDLPIPEPDPYFVVKADVIDFLERRHKESQVKPVNILVTGMQGCGKTSLGIQCAARWRCPLIIIQCGYMTDPTQWWGQREFSQDRGTFYRESQLIKGIETEHCVVLFDEWNRCENLKVKNSLFWLLDERREAWIDEIQRYVKVARGVMFFATLNEGVLFSGTDAEDAALMDRFQVVNLEYPSTPQLTSILTHKTDVGRDTAEKLAAFAESIFKNPDIERKVSVRQLLSAARDIKYGADIGQAVKFAVANAYGQEVEKINSVFASLFPGLAKGSDGREQTF